MSKKRDFPSSTEKPHPGACEEDCRRRQELENPAQNARLKELTDLIEKERDHDKFTKLIAELNALLDEQKKPAIKSSTE